MVTSQQMNKFLSSLPATRISELTEAVNYVSVKFDLSTLRRLRYFMAQTAFESDDFTRFSESLYYTTADRIRQVWPSRFTTTGEPGKLDAKLFVKNQEKLANTVYANRLGNGAPESGDGFRYRGRGAIQLTGRKNYLDASMELFGDDRLVQNPDQVATDMKVCLLTAGWFWSHNGLNALADSDEFTKVTKIINGSTSTVKERLVTLRRANQSFV